MKIQDGREIIQSFEFLVKAFDSSWFVVVVVVVLRPQRTPSTCWLSHHRNSKVRCVALIVGAVSVDGVGARTNFGRK